MRILNISVYVSLITTLITIVSAGNSIHLMNEVLENSNLIQELISINFKNFKETIEPSIIDGGKLQSRLKETIFLDLSFVERTASEITSTLINTIDKKDFIKFERAKQLRKDIHDLLLNINEYKERYETNEKFAKYRLKDVVRIIFDDDLIKAIESLELSFTALIIHFFSVDLGQLKFCFDLSDDYTSSESSLESPYSNKDYNSEEVKSKLILLKKKTSVSKLPLIAEVKLGHEAVKEERLDKTHKSDFKLPQIKNHRHESKDLNEAAEKSRAKVSKVREEFVPRVRTHRRRRKED